MAKKGKAPKYKSIVTHNPKARESDERRREKLHDMAARRLKNQVDRQRDSLIRYIPPEKRGVVSKIAPEYALKGAARAAMSTYQDPNYVPPTEAVNLFHQLGCKLPEPAGSKDKDDVAPPGNLYSHPEGRVLLRYMIEYGTFLHNKMENTREAVKVFNELLSYDKQDHLCARHSLLRCHLDNADGGLARVVIDKYSDIDNNSVTFNMTRVFIEIVSLSLEEEGSSMELVNSLIDNACRYNPYIIWVMTYSHLFGELDELIDELMTTLPQASNSPADANKSQPANRIEFKPDSLEEALIYYRLDSGLWLEVDNSIDLLANYIHEKKLLPSTVSVSSDKTTSSSNSNSNSNSSSSSEKQGGDESTASLPGGLGGTIEMCYEMYNTAVSIIRKELS